MMLSRRFRSKASRFSLLVALALCSSTSNASEPLTLDRALRLAKQRAPEMRAARASIALADAGVDQARSPYFPSLSVTGRGEEIAFGENAGVIPPRQTPVKIVTYTTAGTAAAALRWTVFDFGRTSRSVGAARARRSASVSEAADAEARLIEVVANAFLDVVYEQKARDIAQSILEDREKAIAIAKGLVKQGLVAPVEELRAESRVESARRDLEIAEATLAESRIGLLAFLGLDGKVEGGHPTFVAPHLPRPKIGEQAAMSEADQKKPGVVAARAESEAQAASVEAARARYFPAVSLAGDASYRVANIDIFGGWIPTRVASGALLVSIPVFDAATGATVDGAKAQALRADAAYDQSRRDARVAAAQALVGLDMSERIVESARRAAESATTALTIIRARYAQGLSGTLDLIDAEGTDAEARLATIRASRAKDGAILRLLVAVGRASSLIE